MEKQVKKKTGEVIHGSEFAERVWAESWTYIKTVVDTAHEPFLILNSELCVMAGNDSFYRMFQVEEKDTENKLVYELGNGQWNIPSLKKLLEDILPENTFFKGFEVAHEFPGIGKKVMILNARRIYRVGSDTQMFPPIILLAMEDVTEMMSVAQMLARRNSEFESTMSQRTGDLELMIEELKEEIHRIKGSR